MQFESHDGLGQISEVRLDGTRDRLRFELKLIVKTETREKKFHFKNLRQKFSINPQTGANPTKHRFLCFSISTIKLEYLLHMEK